LVDSGQEGNHVETVQDKEKIQDVGTYYHQLVDTHYQFFDYWLQNTMLHWDFWLSWLLTVVPWGLWIRYRKKESTHRLLFTAFFIIVVSCLLDFVGTMYGLWYYTGKALPLMPVFAPWDFTLLPVFALCLMQWKPHFSPIMKGLIFAGVNAFIGEPLFLWLGMYVKLHWSIWYSAPIYFVIYIMGHKLCHAKHFAPL
jgi:hypothetical protein